MTRSRPARPPTVHRTLLRWTLPSGIRRESIIGDLLEEFAVRAETRSVREARAWYRRQARRVVLQHLLRRGARAARPGVAARPYPETAVGEILS